MYKSATISATISHFWSITMTRRLFPLLLLFLVLTPLATLGQEKRALQHEDVNDWIRLQQAKMSRDGEWVVWTEAPDKGDGSLQVSSSDGTTHYRFDRGTSPLFSGDSKYVLFKIVPQADSVRQKKLDKVKKKDMPSDSLGIVSLVDGSVRHYPNVQSFKVSSESGSLAAFRWTKEASKIEAPADSTEVEELEEEEEEEEEEESEDEDEKDKKEGTTLTVLNLRSDSSEEYRDVTDYVVDQNGAAVVFFRESEDGETDGVYSVGPNGSGERTLLAGEGNYIGLSLSDEGYHLAFLTNRDDFNADQPSFTLFSGDLEGVSLVANEESEGLPDGWWVSEHGSLSFSDSGNRLYFGTAPRPDPEQDDDDILEDEKVIVDIWNWKDPLLQPMQLVQADREKKRTYRAVAHLDSGTIIQLASIDVPTVSTSSDGDGDVVLGVSNMNYRKEISWDSPRFQDAWTIDAETGERQQILTAVQDTPRLSPDGKYVTYWNRDDAQWISVDTSTGESVSISRNARHSLVNDLDDRAYAPSSYGSAGWTEGDKEFILYDKYDILAASQDGTIRNVTEGLGRSSHVRLRFQRLDREEVALPTKDDWMLTALDLDNMDAGFYEVDPRKGDVEKILMSPHGYRIFQKAEDADALLFSRNNFREFPDLRTSNLDFEDPVRISDANPQQANFSWGTSELYGWTSLDGKALKGILYKPDGFDASRQYPMMVYFYEKLSTGLHRHIAPGPARSSINYSFYVSRGYVVFVPDIPYKVGYPGESAMNAVMPGITSLIEEGFVDRNRIGVQGHSWGGYQIAYMVTQTDLFAAAEAGAPVVNMTSAYGGIRWASGMSRMFQYERTQSRIGGTLWNAQNRYIQNSPLFQADKVKTPLLMMHNDEDGAVPWYQGIEYFVALRRLGKPTWMFNYNGSGHGLSDLPDKRDWAIRMQQFFDHYLMDAPAPVWLEVGVPAVKKGKTLGLELIDK